MTDVQQRMFEKYYHIVDGKITKYAPEYAEDEDFRQDVVLCLIEYLASKSDEFLNNPSTKLTARVNTKIAWFVQHLLKKRENDKAHFEDGCVYEEYSEDLNPENIVSEKLLKESLKFLMGTITGREEDVLRMRFGMYDGRTHTLDEVGMIFGVTRHRIHQIENNAIRKFRHPSRRKYIKDFYW